MSFIEHLHYAISGAFSQFIFITTLSGIATVIPILQMKKLRVRVFSQLRSNRIGIQMLTHLNPKPTYLRALLN